MKPWFKPLLACWCLLFGSAASSAVIVDSGTYTAKVNGSSSSPITKTKTNLALPGTGQANVQYSPPLGLPWVHSATTSFDFASPTSSSTSLDFDWVHSYVALTGNAISSADVVFSISNTANYDLSAFYSHAGSFGSATDVSVELQASITNQQTGQTLAEIALTGAGGNSLVDDLTGVLSAGTYVYSFYSRAIVSAAADLVRTGQASLLLTETSSAVPLSGSLALLLAGVLAWRRDLLKRLVALLALGGLVSPMAFAGLIVDPSSEYTSWARTTHWGHNNTNTGSITLPGSGTKTATQYDSGSSTSTTVRNRVITNYTATGDSDAANFLFDWTHDPNGSGNVRSFGTVYFSIDDYYVYDLSGFYDFTGGGTFGGSTSELTVRITNVVSATDVVDISLTGNGHQDLTLSGAGLSGSLAAGDYGFYFFSRIKDTNGVDTLDRAGEVSFSMTAVDVPATGMVLGLGMTALMWRRRAAKEG